MTEFFQAATPITILLYIIFQVAMKWFEMKDKESQREFDRQQTEQKTAQEMELQNKIDALVKKQSELASQLHSKIESTKNCFKTAESTIDNRIDILQQSILDERRLSNAGFVELTHYIINYYVEKTKNEVNDEFDKNGLNTQADIDRLVKNLDYWSKVNRNKAREIIASLEPRYDRGRLNSYLSIAAMAFAEYNQGVQKVLDGIKLEDVENSREKHFVSWKTDMRNEIDDFRDKLKSIIAEVI